MCPKSGQNDTLRYMCGPWGKDLATFVVQDEICSLRDHIIWFTLTLSSPSKNKLSTWANPAYSLTTPLHESAKLQCTYGPVRYERIVSVISLTVITVTWKPPLFISSLQWEMYYCSTDFTIGKPSNGVVIVALCV